MPQIDAADVRTYYQEHGRGDPVVLLHGGLESGADWTPYAEALSDRYRVLAPDRRGHGRTPDVDGPYTYDAMASETIAFLEQQAGAPASLVGYSDGGNVALLVARDRPDLVRSLVTISANFDADGLAPQFLARLHQPDPASPVSQRSARPMRPPHPTEPNTGPPSTARSPRWAAPAQPSPSATSDASPVPSS